MVYDIIIIGGSSAGLMSAIYAARKKMKILLLAKQIGGQCLLANTIENFPGIDSISGKELIGRMFNQLQKYDLEIKDGMEAESIEKQGENFLVKIKNGESFGTKTIIIATGKVLRGLNIPGEKEFKNKGVTYCSICDAPLFSGKDVVVVGSGNSAMESAMDLVKYADKIYVLARREKFKGDEFLREKLKNTGKAEFLTNAEVKEIKGGKFVEKLVYQDTKTKELKEIPVSGVFINIGWAPATGFLSASGGKNFVEMNDKREIIVNHKTQETSVQGVFAAGDVADGLYKQIIIAAGDGAKAALSAYNYLVNKK